MYPKRLHAGELDDLVELTLDLAARHAEDGAGEEDVLSAAQLRVEPCADFQQAADAAANLNPSGGGLGDAAKDLQERRFPGTVAADDPDHFAGGYLEGDVLQSPEDVRRLGGRGEAGRGRTAAANRPHGLVTAFVILSRSVW